jgi:crotonobetainyl-CoA:carnitine CoA-transferase CaiB-like acyl-CoA transferase
MKLLGNPMKIAGVPQKYDAPPRPGENTAESLKELLKMPDSEIDALQAKGVIFDEAVGKRIPSPQAAK